MKNQFLERNAEQGDLFFPFCLQTPVKIERRSVLCEQNYLRQSSIESSAFIKSLLGEMLNRSKNLPKEEVEMRHWYDLYECQPGKYDQVSEFIEETPLLKEFLPIAADKFREVFGAETRLELYKVIDYEIPEETGLYAFIYIDLSVEEAIEKLDMLFEDWFEEYYPIFNGRFSYDVRWSK